MFTKKIPITEPIENHLNSSSDSNGEDSSFEDPDEITYKAPSIEDIKFKYKRFTNYQTTIKNRKKELEKDKTSTMWNSVYYTFFNNNYKSNSITLSELELRCKFLFNMDKYEKMNNKNYYKKTEPLTDLEKFIKDYSQKREDNLLIKIFKKKKTLPISPRSQIIATMKGKDKNYKSLSNNSGNTNYTFGGKNDNNILNNAFISNINDKKRNSKSTQSPRNRIHIDTILDMYELHDSNELVEAIKKEQCEYASTGNKFMLENLNSILENKQSFMNEVDKMNDIFWDNEKMKNKVKNILNVSTTNSFFMSHIGEDLHKKFDNELEPQNNMSRQVNNLYNKIITKLNPLHKINI